MGGFRITKLQNIYKCKIKVQVFILLPSAWLLAMKGHLMCHHGKISKKLIRISLMSSLKSMGIINNGLLTIITIYMPNG